MGPLTIGIKVGQRMEPTGLAVSEQEIGVENGQTVERYTIRFLERLPVGTAYPTIATRLGAVLQALGARAAMTGGMPAYAIYADVTGLGQPVVDVLQEAGAGIIPVFFTHGDRRIIHPDDGTVTLGKAWVVARLQALLQTGRVFLPRMSEAEILAKELIDYQIEVEPDANERYGAFTVGTQDDLVTALGLATQGLPDVEWTGTVWLEDVIGDYRVHMGRDEETDPYRVLQRHLRGDGRYTIDDRY